MSIGRNLRECRAAARLSQEQAAEKLGVTRQTIYRLESDEDDTANTKTLKALADALGVKISDFFMLYV